MTQSPITVTYSLEEVLGQINQKLDTLQKDVSDIKVGQARLEERLTGEIKALNTKIENIDSRLEKLENTQKKRTRLARLPRQLQMSVQVWTLITLLGGHFRGGVPPLEESVRRGSLITVAFRFFLSSSNP